MTKTNTGVLALQLKHCNKKKHYTLARMQNGLGNSVSARLSTSKRHQIQAAMNSPSQHIPEKWARKFSECTAQHFETTPNSGRNE